MDSVCEIKLNKLQDTTQIQNDDFIYVELCSTKKIISETKHAESSFGRQPTLLTERGCSRDWYLQGHSDNPTGCTSNMVAQQQEQTKSQNT